jgi:S-adenosylmethionine hydrolase
MRVITLLTDFGWADGYPGVMKGVILGISPSVQIVDITHEVEPQNVVQAMLLLAQSAPYFPPNTIHVAVVDPGVGTARRAIAARLGKAYFVGPDNGLISLLLQRALDEGQPTHIVHLTRPEYWLPRVSNVFHGRDLFAPVAAYLAEGIPLEELGEAINDPVRLSIPRPERTNDALRGQITLIDHFGNLSTNITSEDLAGRRDVLVRVGEVQIGRLVETFDGGEPGDLVALIDSSGALAIAQVRGSAAKRLNASVGDPVYVEGL